MLIASFISADAHVPHSISIGLSTLFVNNLNYAPNQLATVALSFLQYILYSINIQICQKTESVVYGHKGSLDGGQQNFFKQCPGAGIERCRFLGYILYIYSI